MTAHTPGPWGVAKSDNIDFLAILGSDHHQGDYIAEIQLGEAPDTDRANARLIAAAPDLLEALQELYEGAEPAARELTGLMNDRGLSMPAGVFLALERAREALAKATGEPS